LKYKLKGYSFHCSDIKLMSLTSWDGSLVADQTIHPSM